MKNTEQTKIIKRTIYYKSRSGAGFKYRAERHRDGKAYCTCPSFMYRRTCWHYSRILAIK